MWTAPMTTRRGGATFFLNVHLPPPRLVVIGAVHISQALAPMAKIAGYDMEIVDPRSAFATPERFPDVPLFADWPETVLAARPFDAYTAVAAVTLQAAALFDFDKAVLKPAGKASLDALVADLSKVNVETVIAVGHTDATGSDSYNQRLSIRRVEAVKAYLVSKGVPADRIKTEGKGESQPVASNQTREGRAQNRRVDIEVVGTSKP